MAPRLCSCAVARDEAGRHWGYCVLASEVRACVASPSHRVMTEAGKASTCRGDSSLVGLRPGLAATNPQFTFLQHLVPFKVPIYGQNAPGMPE